MDECTRETTGESSNTRGVRARWRWALVMVYILAIFVASSQSNISIPGGVSDKTAHGVAYSGLSGLIAWALVGGNWRRIRLGLVLLATLLAAVYGLIDELHQLFVPRRSFELLDLAADASGAFAGASTVWAWGILLRWSQRGRDV